MCKIFNDLNKIIKRKAAKQKTEQRSGTCHQAELETHRFTQSRKNLLHITINAIKLHIKLAFQSQMKLTDIAQQLLYITEVWFTA